MKGALYKFSDSSRLLTTLSESLQERPAYARNPYHTTRVYTTRELLFTCTGPQIHNLI